MHDASTGSPKHQSSQNKADFQNHSYYLLPHIFLGPEVGDGFGGIEGLVEYADVGPGWEGLWTCSWGLVRVRREHARRRRVIYHLRRIRSLGSNFRILPITASMNQQSDICLIPPHFW